MDWSIAGPAIAGLFGAFGGVALGAWLTLAGQEKQRRIAFNERQLRELYAPLLAARKEIEVIGMIRVKFSSAADTAWRELVHGRSVEVVENLMDKRFPSFKAIIDYNNDQFMAVVLPLYKKMREVFRENMWLAFPETLDYWSPFIEFIDQWDRFLADSIPIEVHEIVKVEEAGLQLFYAHLASVQTAIKSALLNGKPIIRLPRTNGHPSAEGLE